MDLRLAVLFAAVADERSFARAATRLHIGSPWLASQIRKLEAQLGYDLFVRGKGGVELTAEAWQLLPHARAVTAAQDNLRSMVQTIARERRARVRIGAHLFAESIRVFEEVNDAYVSLHKDASLLLANGDTKMLLDEVRSGRLDLALVMAPFDASGLRTLLMAETTPYLLARRQDRLGGLQSIDGSVLTGRVVRTFRRSEHPRLHDALHHSLTAAGVDLKPAHEMGRSAMEHYVRLRGEPTLMIEGTAQDYADSADLIGVPTANVPKVQHYLAMSKTLDKVTALRYWRMAERRLDVA